MIVSGEPVKSEMLAQAAGPEAVRQDRRRRRRSTARDRLRARDGRRAAAAAGARPARSSTRTRDAYFQFARNTVGGDGQELPGAAEVRRRGRRVDEDEVRRRHEATSASSSSALMLTPEIEGAAPRLHGRARGDQDPRRAGRHADARRSRRSAVIGAGTMGGGIAMNFLNAGIPVDDPRDEAGSARQGRRPPSARTTRRRSRRASSSRTSSTQRMALLTTTLNYDDLEGRRPRHRGGVRGHGRQGDRCSRRSTR